MKIDIFAFSRQGQRTAERIGGFFPQDECSLFAPERLAGGRSLPIPVPSEAFYGDRFARADALIFVGACGIAVRVIAPHIRSKLTDPAVLCIDEPGRFVIPILSGHIGGANALAEKLAEDLGAQAVITTATDVSQRFSVDAWAAASEFIISDMDIAKEISAAILERDIPVCSSLQIVTELPNGLTSGDSGPLGIFIGREQRQPFMKTLRLIPQDVHLGIGCRRGIDAGAVRQAVRDLLTQTGIDPAALKCAATITLKWDEAGLLRFCEEAGLPVSFYSAEELRALPGKFSHSDFVEKTTGVGNVCERAAMMNADSLIVRKTVFDGVTLALAAERNEVRFG